MQPDHAVMAGERTITVGELKARFSEALDAVRAGETLIVAYGRRRTRVAALVPYSTIAPAGKRKLGVLQGKAKLRIARDFALSDTELLKS